MPRPGERPAKKVRRIVRIVKIKKKGKAPVKLPSDLKAAKAPTTPPTKPQKGQQQQKQKQQNQQQQKQQQQAKPKPKPKPAAKQAKQQQAKPQTPQAPPQPKGNNDLVVFETSMGTFKAKLYADKMPITVGNFICLANKGFYNGLHFHRVISGFMLQFGCPKSRNPKSPAAGTGGPPPGSMFTTTTGKKMERDRGGNIKDEFTHKISNEPGTLSMANTGARNSGGSQFFVNTVHNKFLDWFDRSTESRHPVFGKVCEGMNVVRAIEKTRTKNDCPVNPVKMIKVTII
eukprot:TRINITY_DN67920_c8_g2_i1.p1 TRINITY_DN67920_c8_g2~~TRINITY_DN67920_c8_g2_i1.p1  ORF type:complete len:287 (+),score=61.70 TRINITY_DN67920_c8_g2_i1:17-877(+)